MKNILNQAAYAVILSIVFLSCSKEKITKEVSSSATTTTNNAPGSNSRIIPGTSGSIAGILIPFPLKSVIVAYNSVMVSNEVTANADGSFIITALPPGTYHVAIRYVLPNATDYAGKVLDKVLVVAGSVTNLGNINL